LRRRAEERDPLQCELAAFRARDGQKRGDQPGHAVDVAIQRFECAPVFRLGAGPAEGKIDLAAHEAERGAQFVGGVGGELPLLFEPALDAGKHAVEGLGQPAELVVRQVEREAGVQIGRIDGGGQLGDLAHRGKRPPGHEIAAARREQ
jgi:hypothetical protein